MLFAPRWRAKREPEFSTGIEPSFSDHQERSFNHAWTTAFLENIS
jgi:hypothetical protein